MLNLVSDSSCDLISGELNSPYARLTVAPMCLHVGGQDYLDTPELDIPALLSKLAHHRSSSACPSPAAYAEAFEQGEETVCVTISSQLSGSYNAAMAARDLVLAEHPEKKIFVLDSRATSGASNLCCCARPPSWRNRACLLRICARSFRFVRRIPVSASRWSILTIW